MNMPSHEFFQFPSKEALLQKAALLDLSLPFSDSTEPFWTPESIDGVPVPNRFAVQPMEGFDAGNDGQPGPLAFRRYERYARGGSGLIWFEATCVVPEGRSNPRQLLLSAKTSKDFHRLTRLTRRAAFQSWGSDHRPFLVLQLTHSGRYSRPRGKPAPLAADKNPFLDDPSNPPTILDDDALATLEEYYVDAARLAYEAGFDGVDIKACHGYLVHNLLAAHSREHSRYGGERQKRFRFLLSVVRRIRDRVPQLHIAVRLNATDRIPFPYGFGVPGDGTVRVDLSEPAILVERLIAEGCTLLNITAGNPMTVPHWTRPFDRPVPGAAVPDEHPLEGVIRLIRLAGEIQKRFPDLPVVGTGYSWLRQYAPGVGAAVLQQGDATFIGLGRSSFAYPDAPRDLLHNGSLDPHNVCTTCSRCTELMRRGQPTGCVLRDKAVYGKIYDGKDDHTG